MSHLLLDETPLVVLPTLAKIVGINEAIAIQQIHWVCKVKAEHEDYRTFHDDEMWCSYKLDQWLQKMPWLKDRTCRRMLSGLEERKILIVAKPHSKNWNHTKWYRIDYAVLDKLTRSENQICQNDVDKLTRSDRTNLPDLDVDKLTRSDRTNLPDLDVDKLTDSSIDKKDIKNISKERSKEREEDAPEKISPQESFPEQTSQLVGVNRKPDPYFDKRQNLTKARQAIANQHSVKDSPFESVEEMDNFYAYAFAELSKNSKKFRPDIENEAKWMVLRLQRGQDDPRDRQYLSQFRTGLTRVSREDELLAFAEAVQADLMRKYAS